MQMPLSVLLPPFLKVITADLPMALTSPRICSGNIPVPLLRPSGILCDHLYWDRKTMLTSVRPRDRYKDPETLQPCLAQPFPLGLLSPSWPLFLMCEDTA